MATASSGQPYLNAALGLHAGSPGPWPFCQQDSNSCTPLVMGHPGLRVSPFLLILLGMPRKTNLTLQVPCRNGEAPPAWGSAPRPTAAPELAFLRRPLGWDQAGARCTTSACRGLGAPLPPRPGAPALLPLSWQALGSLLGPGEEPRLFSQVSGLGATRAEKLERLACFSHAETHPWGGCWGSAKTPPRRQLRGGRRGRWS